MKLHVPPVSGVYKKFIKKLIKEYARSRFDNLTQKENQSAADFLVVIKRLIQVAGWTDTSIVNELTKKHTSQRIEIGDCQTAVPIQQATKQSRIYSRDCTEKNVTNVFDHSSISVSFSPKLKKIY